MVSVDHEDGGKQGPDETENILSSIAENDNETNCGETQDQVCYYNVLPGDRNGALQGAPKEGIVTGQRAWDRPNGETSIQIGGNLVEESVGGASGVVVAIAVVQVLERCWWCGSKHAVFGIKRLLLLLLKFR